MTEDAHALTCTPMCDRPCSPACVERHAPTDDEREALEKAIHYLRGAYRIRTPAKRDETILGAIQILRGLAAGFRRTVQGDHYDEGTLVKVYDSLQSVMPDVSEWVIRDQVNAMQNAGILFRERIVRGEPNSPTVTSGAPEPQGEPSDAAVREAVSAERKAIASLLMSLGDRMTGEGTQAGYYAAAHEVRQRERAALRAAAEAEGGNR